jgi:hypothetical protein
LAKNFNFIRALNLFYKNYIKSGFMQTEYKLSNWARLSCFSNYVENVQKRINIIPEKRRDCYLKNFSLLVARLKGQTCTDFYTESYQKKIKKISVELIHLEHPENEDKKLKYLNKVIKISMKLLCKRGQEIFVTEANLQAKEIELEKQCCQLVIKAGYDLYKRTILQMIVLEFKDKPDQGIELINYALSQGAEINACDDLRKTPLHVSQNAAIVKHLIECGANLNIQNLNGETPLHCSNNLEKIQILVDHGVKTDIIDIYGRTVLESQFEQYIYHPSKNKEIIEFLLKQGLTFNDYKGQLLKLSFLNAITLSFPFCDTGKACLGIAKELISLGADLKTSDPQGKLLIMSLTGGMLCSDELRDKKAFFFMIADELAPLVPNLAVCDPSGTLLEIAVNEVTHINSLRNEYWLNYYLNVFDKLSAMGSAHLDIVDPKGKLMKRILKKIIEQSPENNSDFLKPYFQVVDKLIQMGATLANSDSYGEILRDTIERASSGYSTKNITFYLAIAKGLIERGVTLEPLQIDQLNRSLSNKVFLWTPDKNAVIREMIQAGLPLEIVAKKKTLEEWKKELNI